MRIHNLFRARDNKEAIGADYYQGENPQRMYMANTVNFWVNKALRSSEGMIIKDIRYKIDRVDLLKGENNESIDVNKSWGEL